MISLESVQSSLAPHGYSAEPASEALFSVLEADLSDDDYFDLGNTWRKDWRSELRATLSYGTSTLSVTSADHKGVAVFGATRANANSAQMWLLQSKTFTNEAELVHGAAWPIKAVEMSNAVVNEFCGEFDTVFNFKNRNQTRSIKWLRVCGFEFFEQKDIKCDTLFFGKGPQTVQLANDLEFWNSYLGKELLQNHDMVATGTTRRL